MKVKHWEESNIKTITSELCECKRLYKDSINEEGRIVCSACSTGLAIESLKILWETPLKKMEEK